MGRFPPIGPHAAVKCFRMDLMAECRCLTRRPESWQSAVVLLSLFSSWAPTERIRSAGLSLLPPPSVPHSDVLPRSPSLVLARLFCSYAVPAAFQREYFLLSSNFCSNAIQIGVHCSRICMITSTISASVSLSDLHLCPPPSIIWLRRKASFPLIVVALLPVRVQPNVAAFTPSIRKYLNASVIQCNWTTRVTWTLYCCITLNEKH